MLGVYNYTVILTYLGMLFGFTGITFTLSGNVRAALICLMLAGLCDMFDGKVASTMKTRTAQEKRFGVQIDSLSDLICFGVLPAMIIYTYCNTSKVSFYIAGLYVLCALIRLAWFNVDEEERQDQEDGCREIYMGLPVTISALIIPILMSLGGRLELPMEKIGPWLLLVIAVAFLTPFRLKKPATFGKIVMLLVGIAGMGLVLTGGLNL